MRSFQFNGKLSSDPPFLPTAGGRKGAYVMPPRHQVGGGEGGEEGGRTMISRPQAANV